MSILLWVLIGFILLGLASGIYFILFRGRNGKKYPFLLYSRDGKHVTTIYPQLKINPDNTVIKQFYFQDYKEKIEVKPPTKWLNNIGYREITYNNKNEFSYLEGTFIDDKKHIAISLEPEEKSLALFRYKQNYERYKETMNKYQAYTMIGGFILIFLIALGVVYSTIAYVQASGNMVELEQENIKIKEIHQQNLETMNEIVKQLVMISGKNQNGEIIRPLS